MDTVGRTVGYSIAAFKATLVNFSSQCQCQCSTLNSSLYWFLSNRHNKGKVNCFFCLLFVF